MQGKQSAYLYPAQVMSNYLLSRCLRSDVCPLAPAFQMTPGFINPAASLPRTAPLCDSSYSQTNQGTSFADPYQSQPKSLPPVPSTPSMVSKFAITNFEEDPSGGRGRQSRGKGSEGPFDRGQAHSQAVSKQSRQNPAKYWIMEQKQGKTTYEMAENGIRLQDRLSTALNSLLTSPNRLQRNSQISLEVVEELQKVIKELAEDVNKGRTELSEFDYETRQVGMRLFDKLNRTFRELASRVETLDSFADGKLEARFKNWLVEFKSKTRPHIEEQLDKYDDLPKRYNEQARRGASKGEELRAPAPRPDIE